MEPSEARLEWREAHEAPQVGLTGLALDGDAGTPWSWWHLLVWWVTHMKQCLHHSPDSPTAIHSHQLLHRPLNASSCSLRSGCCYQLFLPSRSLWEYRDSALKQRLLWVKPGGLREGGESCCLLRWNSEELSSVWFLAAGLLCSMPNHCSWPGSPPSLGDGINY